MAEICKVESELEVKCSPQKFYEWVKYSMHHLPAIFPDLYKEGRSEGDGVGSTLFLKYLLPGTTDELTVSSKIIKQDDENMVTGYLVEEGDLHDHYSHFTAIVQVGPKGEEGSLVKWTVEFEKHHDEIPDPHHYLDLFLMLSEKVDTHLLSV